MSLFVPWLVFPLVLAALCFGSGLLLERIAGTRLPSALLLPSGLAAIVVVSSLTVSTPTTARLTTPLVGALAVTGLFVGRPRWPGGWAAASAFVAYVGYGAPVLASGRATFTGYVKLDDTATFLAFTDRVLEYGRSLAGLAPSSYETTLDFTVAAAYPLGSVLPLGIGRELVRTDAAWLYQPWLAFCAAMLSFCLYELAAPLVASRPLRALASCVAAQSALLYGVAGWGGVKELAAAALIATAAAVTVVVREPYSARALLPLAVAAAAVLDTLSLAGAVWLLPLVGTAAVLLRRRLSTLAAALGIGLLLAAPALATAAEFLRGSNRAVFVDDEELGNLIGPLHPLQIAGIWPSGDFRVDPEATLLTALLVALASASVLVGVGLATHVRARALLLAFAGALAGAFAFAVVGAPWLAAKAFAMGSPIIVLCALCGALALATNLLALQPPAARWSLAVGSVLTAAIVAGVVWSNALAYHDVNLAPREQLAELESVGDRFAGQGPALMTEYQPYGVRHFLRSLDAEGSSELRRRPILLRGGRPAAKAEYVDVDEIRLADLLVYRTLVLRRSPARSRPPAPYRLAWAGRWYEVWQRGDTPAVVEHLPLGSALEPAATPTCALVRDLSALGPLVAPPRGPNAIAGLDSAPLPAGWSSLGGGAVLVGRTGTLTVPIELARGGRHRVWVGGSVRGTLKAAVDGVEVGTVSSQLQHAGQWLDVGDAVLLAGGHQVSLEVTLPSLAPGAGGGGFPLGPLVLEPLLGERALIETSSPDALCGRTLDWVEAIAR